ncbi:MAG: dual specificity protein phosphatase family protein [Phycisphaerae bacterium]|nr:dual specificity protein phosphatase family protein [Phycisphaerae bacterium]
MKSKNSIPLIILISLIAVLNIVGCKKEQPIAMTGATLLADVVLPPETDTYDVLGEISGIKGYIIKYSDKIYRGGDILSEDGMKYLKDQGITGIVSVSPTDLERNLAKQYEIEIFEAEFEKKPLDKKLVQNALAFIEQTQGPVYIHCHSGCHRGGIICCAYRIHQENWPIDKATVEFGRLGGCLKEDFQMLESINTLN